VEERVRDILRAHHRRERMSIAVWKFVRIAAITGKLLFHFYGPLE